MNCGKPVNTIGCSAGVKTTKQEIIFVNHVVIELKPEKTSDT